MIKKKLSAKGGFTLTELLTAMAVMALVGVAVAVGISAAAKAYFSISASSQAAVLGGTLAVELADELRFAENIILDSGGTALETFDSRRFGPNVKIMNGSDHIAIATGTANYNLLAAETYTGLHDSVAITYANNRFNVTITIKGGAGTALYQNTLSVAPLTPP